MRPPFSPESVVAEFADLLKSYRVSDVTGDRYGGEWPREQFRKCGVQYELSQRPKSDLYRDFLPLINSRQVELLDLPRCIAQLCSLERRTARGGRESIDHAPGAHDDIANAIAGLAVHLDGALDDYLDWIYGPHDKHVGRQLYQRKGFLGAQAVARLRLVWWRHAAAVELLIEHGRRTRTKPWMIRPSRRRSSRNADMGQA